VRFASLLSLLAVCFAGCAPEQPPVPSDLPRQEAKTVSVAIGMPVEELARQPSVISLDGPNISTAMFFTINEPVDLEMVVGTEKLRLPNVGGSGLEATFVIENGSVRDASISPASRTMNLSEALAVAGDLALWFENAGLVSGRRFEASHRKRDTVLPEITTAAEAEAALRDEKLMIASMGFYSGANRDVDAIVIVSSPPRIRALAGNARVALDSDVWSVRLELARLREAN
jgi:hypothetical protein